MAQQRRHARILRCGGGRGRERAGGGGGGQRGRPHQAGQGVGHQSMLHFMRSAKLLVIGFHTAPSETTGAFCVAS